MTRTGEHDLNARMTALEIALATLGATLSTKLDALIGTLGTLQVDHEARLRALEAQPQDSDDHAQRLGRLERAWYVAAGAAVALGGTSGALVQALMP